MGNENLRMAKRFSTRQFAKNWCVDWKNLTPMQFGNGNGNFVRLEKELDDYLAFLFTYSLSKVSMEKLQWESADRETGKVNQPFFLHWQLIHTSLGRKFGWATTSKVPTHVTQNWRKSRQECLEMDQHFKYDDYNWIGITRWRWRRKFRLCWRARKRFLWLTLTSLVKA